LGVDWGKGYGTAQHIPAAALGIGRMVLNDVRCGFFFASEERTLAANTAANRSSDQGDGGEEDSGHR